MRKTYMSHQHGPQLVSMAIKNPRALETPRTAIRPVVLAVHLTIACIAISSAMWTTEVQAQESGAQQVRQYRIPAGSLNTVLNRFAEDAGVLLGPLET